MKIINDLYTNVRKVDWYKSQFKWQSGKQNILFIDPVMMNFDFYSMIVPYLALAEIEDKYNTAITGLYRYSEMDTKPQTRITEAEIRWANVVVYPNSTEDFKMLHDEIKECNPFCKIIQTVEFDFYEMGNDHYMLEDKELEIILNRRKVQPTAKAKAKLRADLKEYIIKRLHENMKYADRLIVLNENLMKKLQQKGFKDVQYCPILIDEHTFLENLDYQDSLGQRLTEKMFTLSCELRDHNKHAFKEFVPIFEQLQEKHKKRFKLVVLGESPKEHFPSLDLEYIHLKTGSIVSHFKSIWKSSADIHLVLNKKNLYTSNSMALYNWIDRGIFGIPIVSLDVSPLKELIKHGENGFILRKRADLISLIDEHIKSKKMLIEMSKSLKQMIIKSCQVSDENLIWLGKVFMDFKDPETQQKIEEQIEQE